MITINRSAVSCGMVELGGEIHYKTAEVYFKDFAARNFHPNGDAKAYNESQMINLTSPLSTFSCFVWTHNPTRYDGIGDKIQKYIEDNKLGIVVKSAPAPNPVHQDIPIVVWVWSRDNEAFAKHCKELLKPKATEVVDEFVGNK